MVVFRKIVAAGDGVNYPRKGDTVTLEYTGFILNGVPGTDTEQRGNQ
jgi:FKBP-type peptidyl-prolyl cis-trans isomerase